MGTLPPITPITEETYQQFNIPWFSLADGHVPSVSATSSVLADVKSVMQLDKAKRSQMPELTDPDPFHPPMCSLHSWTKSTCLFRPCSHPACSTCLGTALLKRSHCPKCGSQITRFVGMNDPVPQVSEADESKDGEPAWNVSQMEDLALRAVDYGNITIIHLEEDRVAPLHRIESQ